MKKAVLNVPHDDSENSIRYMLESVGYECYSPKGRLWKDLSNCCDQPVRAKIKLGCSDPDLIVVIKHFYVQRLIKRNRGYRSKLLWLDINGGTPGQDLQKFNQENKHKRLPLQVPVPYVGCNKAYLSDECQGPRYVCYLPLTGWDRYYRESNPTGEPCCLVHNVQTWGFGRLVDGGIRDYVRLYGKRSPDGPIPKSRIPNLLADAICYVHIKGRDCPGYSLFQALASACPVVITETFLRRTQYTDLYKDGATCRVVPDGNTQQMIGAIQHIVEELKDPRLNKQIGEEGRERLKKLMWNKSQDSKSLDQFLKENYGTSNAQ